MNNEKIIARIREIDAIRARITAPAFSVEEITALQDERKDLLKRHKRNKKVRERNQALRDLGLTKTKYGWE